MVLLAGAGVGLLAMYLFDPRNGSSRRKFLRDSAMRTAGHARHAAGAAIGEIGGQLAGKLSHLHESTMHHANEKIQSVKESASEAMDDLRHRANLALGRESEHHYLGQTTCALGSMALGAGLVWMFDPHSGPLHRAWLADKGMTALNETAEFFRRTGGYIAGRIWNTEREEEMPERLDESEWSESPPQEATPS